MITAIETRYAGRRFRSRLEARWAVFFDAFGMRWEYEPESFALPSGAYLPDFKLSVKSRRGCREGEGQTRSVWFEVKPEDAKVDDLRWSELAKSTGMDVFVAYGMGSVRSTDSVPGRIDLWSKDGGWDTDYRFCICAKCRSVGLEFDGRTARLCSCHGQDADKGYNFEAPELVRAHIRALSARFEFGEAG